MTEEIKLRIGELTERGDFGRGIVRISAKDMKRLGITEGDVVEIEGKRKTAAIVIRAYPADVGLDVIRMDGLVRRNCNAGIGEPVIVRKADVKEAKSVTIAPARKGIIIHIGSNLLKQNLLMRPVVTGDIITPNPVVQDRRNQSTLFEQFFGVDFGEFFFTPFGEEKFVVVSADPKGILRITRATDVELLPQATKPFEEEKIPEVTYEDLGGLHEEVQKVREMIELPLKHPELFERLGIEPPKGILLHGPPGCGKTLLAKAVANESGARFFVINGPEVMCVDGETEIKTTEGVKKAKSLYQDISKSGKITERKENLEVVIPDRDFFVYAVNEKNEIVEDRIHHAFKLKSKIYKVKLSNGAEVRASHNQPLMIKKENRNEWIPVRELKGNEQATIINENKIEFADVKSIEELGEGEVFDFAINPYSNFIGGNPPVVLLHNSKFYGESEENLRKIFDQGEKSSPAIIFIDEIDAIAPKREEVKGEVEKRVVSQLLCLDPKTLIYTPKGIFTIEELYNSHKTDEHTKDNIKFTKPKNFEVLGLKDNKITPVKVKLMNKLYVPDTVDVYIDNGSKVTVSAIQRFMTVKNGKMAWKHISDLKPNDIIAVPQHLPAGSKTTFDIFDLDGNSYVLKIEGELKKFFGSNYIKLRQLKKAYSENTTETLGLLRFRLIKSVHELKTFDLKKLMNHTGIKNTYSNRVAVRRMLKNFIEIGTIKAETENHERIFKEASALPPFSTALSDTAGIAHKKGKLFPIKEKYFVKPVLQLNEDLAELIGYILSDGSLNYRRVHVGGKPEIVNRSASIITNLFGITPRVSFDRIHRMDAGSITLANLMSDLYKLSSGKKAYTVEVPKYMYTTGKGCIARFVRAYIDCDGEIGKTKIRAFSRSREMMLGISRLLTILSIPTRITKSNYNMWYSNVVGGYNSYIKFSKQVGSIRHERTRKIENLLERIKKISRGTAPEVEKQLYDLQKRHHVKIQDGDYRYLTGTNNLTWNKFEYFVDLFDEDIEEDDDFAALKEIREAELRWIKIERISKAEPMWMYDLTTETENFVGGELPTLLHNTLMDGLKSRGKLIVIGATNIPNSIDPALRRPGRFDREIEIGVPTKEGRKEILQIHTRGMPLAKDVDLDRIAEITYGYVGADISALCKEAAMHAMRRVLPDLSELHEDKPIPPDVLKKLIVTKDDYDHALKMVGPSAMREVLIEMPKVKWEEIGGLDTVKQSLREVVEWPLKYPDSFKRLGITPPKGILLYGPPGCGKTLLAKAVANESGANFISVKGPELLSMWVGESEKHVRDVFRRAKQVAPAIIFFDEIDALVPRRGYGADTHATERVVSQLLAEISGLEELHDVVVIAASNRPDMVDPALLRPGRFDRQILVNTPDERARYEILKVHAKGMPLLGVDLKKLAKETDGYSGADIEALCREAGMNAMRANIETKEITRKDFDAAFMEVKPSVSDDMNEFYATILKKRKAQKIEEEVTYMG